MILKATHDIFGNVEHFTSDKFRVILDLLDGFMKGKPYNIKEIRIDDINDPVERVDVEIVTTNEKNQLYQQKLLILNDEVIDGLTFHKRYHEWYK